MKAYVYVIATDRGSAPNYEHPCTTLAICKPDIRRCAPIGSLVLAFTGSTLGREPHAVCWAGVIEDKLTFAQYWDESRFDGKKPHRSATPDNIYEPHEMDLRQVPNTTHDGGNVATDLSGKYVLLFNDSWHFGATGPILPAEFGLRIVGGRRRHRVHDLSATRWMALRAWLNKHQRRGAKISGTKCRGARLAAVSVINLLPQGSCSKNR
jgi:hypothetical protein